MVREFIVSVALLFCIETGMAQVNSTQYKAREFKCWCVNNGNRIGRELSSTFYSNLGFAVSDTSYTFEGQRFYKTNQLFLENSFIAFNGDYVWLLQTDRNWGRKTTSMKLFDFKAKVGDSWSLADSTLYEDYLIRYSGNFDVTELKDTIYSYEVEFWPWTAHSEHLKYYLVSRVNGIRGLIYVSESGFASICTDFVNKRQVKNTLKQILNITQESAK
ncbi:MAG: hypothetical protein JNJ75_03580 [Cyclobacteriaceae bacterium]|nr:hypothetical protein [Cyclobacteriaceae bacterium]